jgi:uncharacterized protein (DUF2237 family)
MYVTCRASQHFTSGDMTLPTLAPVPSGWGFCFDTHKRLSLNYCCKEPVSGIPRMGWTSPGRSSAAGVFHFRCAIRASEAAAENLRERVKPGQAEISEMRQARLSAARPSHWPGRKGVDERFADIEQARWREMEIARNRRRRARLSIRADPITWQT